MKVNGNQIPPVDRQNLHLKTEDIFSMLPDSKKNKENANWWMSWPKGRLRQCDPRNGRAHHHDSTAT